MNIFKYVYLKKKYINLSFERKLKQGVILDLLAYSPVKIDNSNN